MDSRAIDVNAAWLGVPTERLMENAGKAISQHCSGFHKIAVVCGGGNNGGDGLVAARYLLKNGADVDVFALEGNKTPLNQKNMERLDNAIVKKIKTADDFSLNGYDLIVDALVGVGVKGEIRQPLKGIIEKINSSDAHKISVDTPSAGLVEADAVVSLHSAKVPGAIVEDIGIPKEAELICGPGDVQVAIPKRESTSHKGDYGRLLVFGGSKKYIGTPTLVAQAALKSGADLVTVCVPQYVADKMPFDANLIVHPLKSKDKITVDDVKEVLTMRFDALVFGNGIGQESADAVKYLMENVKAPVVVDADALGCAKKEWIKNNMILTPHSGEYAKLFGKLEKDMDDVAEASRQCGAVVVLKGAEDIISNGTTTRVNKSGNAYMTVGGTGDVLAGVIGGMLAQNKDLMKSACGGAFLTGLAGDMAADEVGVSLTATDVIAKIPQAIKDCMEVV